MLIILAAIFLGSFVLLFSVWLIVWSWVMSPMQGKTQITDYTIHKPL